MDDNISGILSHNEDLLNVPDSRVLDTGVLEPVYYEHIVHEVISSGSIVAHHLEKSSSHFPNEEPLLHAGSGTIILPYTLYLCRIGCNSKYK